jgi:hypothetical protein
MSLKSYERNRWIRRHDTSPLEISNLFALADRDIEQSQVPGLGPEWRFDIAYNSALQSATAALAAAGYRAERANKHQRVIECLEFTAAPSRTTVRVLNRFRRKRHVAVYERTGAVTNREAEEMMDLAKEIRQRVEAWIRTQHPELLTR